MIIITAMHCFAKSLLLLCSADDETLPADNNDTDDDDDFQMTAKKKFCPAADDVCQHSHTYYY